MNPGVKKVIAFVAGVLLVAAVIVGTVLIAVNYNKKKPERLTEDFIEKITGVWEGTNDISSLRFDESGGATLTVLRVPVSGSYTVDCDSETHNYTLNLSYKSSIGISVSRSFDAVLYEAENKLVLKDKQSGVELTYYKSDSASVLNETTAQTQTTKKSESTSDQKTDSAFEKSLLGKWESASENSGYEFLDGGVVNVSLLSFSVEGTYTVTPESDGRVRLKISYKPPVGASVSNSYYAVINGDSLVLTQIGYETVSLNYTRA